MSYVSIAEQLVQILNDIESIEVVYDHEPKELGKYPAACVTALGHKNSFNDTVANKREFSFMIRLYHYIDSGEDGAIDSEQILRQVTDDVISAIESNITLNNSCDWADPSEGKFLYQERELPMRLVEITVTAKKRVLR
jgi:hypothetical protein